MLIYKNICTLLLLLAVSLTTQAQVANEFTMVRRSSIGATGNGSLGPLITGKGKVAGTSQVLVEDGDPDKYSITANGANAVIKGMSYLRYAEQGNRLVTYGMPLYRHVAGSAFIRFYTGNGSLLKETERIVDFPYASCLSDQGDFYIVGYNYEEGDEAVTLIKFDGNGEEVWTRPLAGGMPSRISISPDEQHIAVSLNSYGNNRSRTYYFTASGQEVGQGNHNFVISASEFLSNGNIVLAAVSNWYLYNFSSNTILAYGRCPANVVGEYPITDDPTRQAFTINSLLKSGNDSAGIRLQAFDATDGTLLSEGEFYGDVHFTSHRLLNIKADNSFELKLDSDVYEINYTR